MRVEGTDNREGTASLLRDKSENPGDLAGVVMVVVVENELGCALSGLWRNFNLDCCQRIWMDFRHSKWVAFSCLDVRDVVNLRHLICMQRISFYLAITVFSVVCVRAEHLVFFRVMINTLD